jgi:hypothetical protein
MRQSFNVGIEYGGTSVTDQDFRTLSNEYIRGADIGYPAPLQVILMFAQELARAAHTNIYTVYDALARGYVRPDGLNDLFAVLNELKIPQPLLERSLRTHANNPEARNVQHQLIEHIRNALRPPATQYILSMNAFSGVIPISLNNPPNTDEKK